MKTPRVILAFVLGITATTFAYGQRDIPKDLVIELVRSPCYGSCPSYSLRITADGSVTFRPISYSGSMTMFGEPLKGRVTRQQLRQLLSEFRKIKFRSIRSRIEPSDRRSIPECRIMGTDAPSAETILTAAGTTKRVYHYLGCHGSSVVEDLNKLDNLIDEVANTQQWTSKFKWSTVGAGGLVKKQ